MDAQINDAAQALFDWFEELLHLCDQSIFAIAQSQQHRRAVILGTLTRNAKRLTESVIDEAGALYTPLCFALAAASSKLEVIPNAQNWSAALRNVRDLVEKLPKTDGLNLGLEFGTPASIFKALMDETLINAGVTDKPTLLDEENRNLSLGLSINWGMRFLIAYALESTPKQPFKRGTKGFGWLSRLAKEACAGVSSRGASGLARGSR